MFFFKYQVILKMEKIFMQDEQTKPLKKSENIKKVQKYIEKYLDDLMFHFDLSERELSLILNQISRNINKKNTTKKWWHFFKLK